VEKILEMSIITLVLLVVGLTFFAFSKGTASARTVVPAAPARVPARTLAPALHVVPRHSVSAHARAHAGPRLDLRQLSFPAPAARAPPLPHACTRTQYLQVGGWGIYPRIPSWLYMGRNIRGGLVHKIKACTARLKVY
jgi:hypothetical protein